MLNQLTFVPGESPTHGLHFWEPVVDERPLRHLLNDARAGGSAAWEVGDMVPVLAHSWPIGLPGDVFVLLGEQRPELVSGRIPLFVCPACGDLGCGAVTAAVEWTTDTVIQRDFGWDVNYDLEDEDDARKDGDRVSLGPFVFLRTQYEAELRRFIATFDQVRASLPAQVASSERLP